MFDSVLVISCLVHVASKMGTIYECSKENREKQQKNILHVN